ncbi:hypothetical protein [Salinarimonas sp.]|uniref:hypothetical protein n=1 Tax=Salinarimonas sp. TaxID=2766526 RepID=UPI00391A1FE1
MNLRSIRRIRLALVGGIAVAAVLQALAPAPAAAQIAVMHKITPQVTPQALPQATPRIAPPVAPQVSPPRAPIVRPDLPRVRIDADVAERLRDRTQSAGASASASGSEAVDGAVARTESRRTRNGFAALPPPRPRDLGAFAAQIEEAQAARDLRETAAALGGLSADLARADFGGLGDPLAGTRTDNRDDARRARVERSADALLGRGREPDPMGNLGLPQNSRSRAEAPGLRPDPTSVSPGNIAGNDFESTTYHYEGTSVTQKTVFANGGVLITHTKSDDHGSHVNEVNYDASGNVVYTYDSIQTPSGLRRDIMVFGNGEGFVQDYDRSGRIVSVRPWQPGDLARLETGDEMRGGGWCPPSGWGCSAPSANSDALLAGSRRERPAGDADPVGPAPSLAVDRGGLVVNPDPERMQGGGGSRAARSFDGGKLVNPGGPR